MTEKKLYLIVQSVVCVLLVILLAASALSIYREGKARKAEDPMESIYTVEKAAEKAPKPAAPAQNKPKNKKKGGKKKK